MSSTTVTYLWPISYKIWLCVLVAPRWFRINSAGSNQSRYPKILLMLLRHRTHALLSMSNSSNSNHNGEIQYMLQFPWRTVFCISLKTRNFHADSVVPNEFFSIHACSISFSKRTFCGIPTPTTNLIKHWLLIVLELCLVTFATGTSKLTNKRIYF